MNKSHFKQCIEAKRVQLDVIKEIESVARSLDIEMGLLGSKGFSSRPWAKIHNNNLLSLTNRAAEVSHAYTNSFLDLYAENPNKAERMHIALLKRQVKPRPLGCLRLAEFDCLGINSADIDAVDIDIDGLPF